MKKRYASLLIGVLALGGLVGCGDSAPATINNLSENAVHGKVYGFHYTRLFYCYDNYAKLDVSIEL